MNNYKFRIIYGEYSGLEKKAIDFVSRGVSEYINYAHLNIDGVYFQSFTETKDDSINNVVIAERDKITQTTHTIWSNFLKMPIRIHLSPVAFLPPVLKIRCFVLLCNFYFVIIKLG